VVIRTYIVNQTMKISGLCVLSNKSYSPLSLMGRPLGLFTNPVTYYSLTTTLSTMYITITFYCRLMVIIILYFIIGSLIMKYSYKATGSDIIPNKKFWMTLPLLVKVKF